MPRPRLFLSVVIGLCASGCGLLDFDSSADYDFVDERGTLELLFPYADEPQYAVYPASVPSTRFCIGASDLAEELRWDGATVVFTGDREPIPPDVRMACAPFDLVEIGPAPRFGRRDEGR